MKVKFDFMLNTYRYGVVEQAIFRMVLRGIDSAQAISELLWIFSDNVKAAAIQKLVNTQVLRADLSSNKLFLSDGIISIIEACRDSIYDIELPEILLSKMTDRVLLIENRQVIISILNHMLPDINIDFLASALSFSVTKAGCVHE